MGAAVVPETEMETETAVETATETATETAMAVAVAMSAEGDSSTETMGVETMVLPNLEAPPCVAHFHGGRITKALYQRVAQDLACRGWGLPSSVDPARCHSEGGGGGEESGGRTVPEGGG